MQPATSPSRPGLALLVLVAGLAAAPASAQDANACDVPGEVPDVIVGDLQAILRYGTDAGITAFSLATTSCNVGTCWVTWTRDTPDHPVIAQNAYRLKDGRFEQIGQSWLKHAFFAVSDDLCYDDCIGTSGGHLGVHCSDPYSATFNGQQQTLGPRFEVNASTGVFPFPHTARNQTGGVIYKRLQIKDEDLDPAQNEGALYFVEGQYVNEDDATAGTDLNNASHRPALASGVPGLYDLDLAGETVREQPAILAWGAHQPGVDTRYIDVADDGRFIAAAAVVEGPRGTFRYEYAVHNYNSHRSAGAFNVPVPAGALIEAAGFHDVDYHSGEPFDGTDWAIEVVEAPSGHVLRWSTVPFETNANANALRWGTLYNFWFVSSVPPMSGSVALDLFRPGSPGRAAWTTHAPRICDGDGACEPGETCGNCAADCLGQAAQCCGDGRCEVDEDLCGCPADCGPVPALEQVCDDGLDLDCDGAADCLDIDCCAAAGCDNGIDGDGDGVAGCDCDDGDAANWTPPGEVTGLRLETVPGGTRLTWLAPVDPGGESVVFDVIRSPAVDDFTGPASCVASNTDVPEAMEGDTPAPGEAFHYLVRPENGCAVPGPLGAASAGWTRSARDCP